MPGEEIDQRLVRLAVDRRSGEAHLRAPAMHPRELGPLSARLHVQVEDDAAHPSDAASGSSPRSITITTICSSTMRTSGVRSKPPTGGIRRRNGRRNGAVMASSA